MDREYVKGKVLEKIAEVLDIPSEEVSEEQGLMEDLDMSSLEIMTMIGDLEALFHITVEEKAMRDIVSAGDLIDCIYQLAAREK